MANLLGEFSQALVAAVEAAGRGVVRVEARSRLPASGVIWSPEGVIVTANHVVTRDEDIHVGLPDGQTVLAELIGRDPGIDLAVLRAQAGNLAPPAWADPEGPLVGTLVLALGRPGQKILATLGVVSALDESWSTPAGGQIDHYLQTDVAMYPGFSGGPLVDADRRVLGLNTSGLVPGLSLAIPASTMRQTVEMLLTHGRVRRGYLGVGVQSIRLQEALSQSLGQAAGLLVMKVEPKSPAEAGGLLLGDILVALDGKPVHAADDLLTCLHGSRVGARMPLRIARGGQVRELEVTIGERA